MNMAGKDPVANLGCVQRALLYRVPNLPAGNSLVAKQSHDRGGGLARSAWDICDKKAEAEEGQGCRIVLVHFLVGSESTRYEIG